MDFRMKWLKVRSGDAKRGPLWEMTIGLISLQVEELFEGAYLGRIVGASWETLGGYDNFHTAAEATIERALEKVQLLESQLQGLRKP